MTTVINVYALINGFPNLELPSVDGEPTLADIQLTTRLLNANTFSVPSVLGGGRHGHLDIIMTTQEYVIMANAPFDALLDPCTIPVIVPGMDNMEANGMVPLYNKLCRIYMEYINIDASARLSSNMTTCTLTQQRTT
jgi:hypothetical protein